MSKPPLHWPKVVTLRSKAFVCGHCGNAVASEKGFEVGPLLKGQTGAPSLYICHHCTRPTFFDLFGEQTPGAKSGAPVMFIPEASVETLFEEARSCFSINAYTSSVICCRKLLMNLAVAQGANEGSTFAEYVTYLASNGYVPPNGRAWVDEIRKLGNEANHKISFRTKEEAVMILGFTEMLLRFVYEMPGLMSAGSTPKP